MTAFTNSGLAPLSELDIDISECPVRELMRRFASTSEMDLDPTVDEQRGFVIGEVVL